METLSLTLPLFLLLFASAYVILATSDPQAFSEKLTRDNLQFLTGAAGLMGGVIVTMLIVKGKSKEYELEARKEADGLRQRRAVAERVSLTSFAAQWSCNSRPKRSHSPCTKLRKRPD